MGPGPAVLPNSAGAAGWEQLMHVDRQDPKGPCPAGLRPELLISQICLTAQEQF